LQWFVNTCGVYGGSTRGLFLSGSSEELAVGLETAVINLKTRNLSPFVVAGETVYQQAEYLFHESKARGSFGRPLASKLESELAGNDIVIVDDLAAPQKPAQLWYLISYVLFPRILAGRAVVITSSLAGQEFLQGVQECPDFDFCGRSINGEKLVKLIEAGTVSQELFNECVQNSLPPMLKAEYLLYAALCERELQAIPQYLLGDRQLDFAMIEDGHCLDIECNALSALSAHEKNLQEIKRDGDLLSSGWQILKFSSSEILNNCRACAECVEAVWRGSDSIEYGCGRVLSNRLLPAAVELRTDEVQRGAIISGGGPLALVGGAGTGKSSCIAERTAWLLARGVRPESILILSYSAESARQLKRKLESYLDRQTVARLSLFPFHELGMKILGENLAAVSRKAPLKIEPEPSKFLRKLINKFKKANESLSPETLEELDADYVAEMIGLYKSHLLSPARAREEAQSESEEIIAGLYQSYEDLLRRTNRIDGDDSGYLAVQILLENAEIRENYQNTFEFVFVDEYEDVTVARDMLARILAGPQDNLFVAGDEDETIAESSNSCPELLGNFSFLYPAASTVLLEHNWRSHPAIVEHAGRLLAFLERGKIKKSFVSAWAATSGAAVFGPQPCQDEAQEVAWIVACARAIIEAGRNAGHIAVLYWGKQYEASLTSELARCNVGFLSGRSGSSMIPDEISDMLAFLKLVMEPDGKGCRQSFERVCQLGGRGIDPALAADIEAFAAANDLSFLTAVETYAESSGDPGCRDLEQLVRIIRAMHQDRLPPFESIGYLRRVRRLSEFYKSIKIPPGQVYEPLKKLTQLEEAARKFSSVVDFVQYVEAGGCIDDDGGELQALQLRSVLDVKGCEFPIVFLCGLAEGLLPAAGSQDMEEDRRQFYVALTRAREAVYLSFPLRSGNRECGPSRFLAEAGLIAGTGVLPEPELKDLCQKGEESAGLESASSSAVREDYPAPVVAAVPVVPVPPSFMRTSELPGFAESAEASRQEAYDEYVASLKKEVTVETEVTSGDPYYAQKDKVSGLSPYVGAGDEDLSARASGYRPPAKGSTPGTGSGESGEEKRQESSEEKTAAENIVSGGKDVYSPVPPLPPPVCRRGRRQSETAAGPDDRAAQEYRAAVEVSALQALKGNSSYLDPALQSRIESAEAGSSLPACPSCGNGLEANALFCGECGYSLPERIAGCSSCGLPLEPGAKFCGECGVACRPHEEKHSESAEEKKSGWMGKFLKFLDN
jgi:DNA helicase II / ATP-dependent DNA helicase PcrA